MQRFEGEQQAWASERQGLLDQIQHLTAAVEASKEVRYGSPRNVSAVW